MRGCKRTSKTRRPLVTGNSYEGDPHDVRNAVQRNDANPLLEVYAMKRYAVECDTPDCGRSTYSECFGPNGKRGRVLSEHDNLGEAIQACDGNPALSTSATTPWIWDRRTGKVVSYERIKAAQTE